MPVRYRTILVGDVKDPKMPPKYTFFLTDHYYANVADASGGFDDWNKLQTGPHRWYYGESHVDLPSGDANADGMSFLPQLAVGRWAVSSPSSVKLMASKTIRYEIALQSGKKSRPDRAAILLWDDLAPRGRIPNWVKQLDRWKPVTYDSDGKGSKPSTAGVKELLNRGVGLLIDIGHGEAKGWPGFKSKDLVGVRNADRLPVVFSVGCDTAPLGPGGLPQTGYRDHKGKLVTVQDLAKAKEPPAPGVYQPELRRLTPPSFGQLMVFAGPNGAVAYLGFTVNSNQWHELMQGFVTAAGQQQPPRLGDAWNSALTHHQKVTNGFFERNKGNFDGLHSFDQGMRAILLGDPTLLLSSR
jgi:hypothetical protein